MRSNFCHAFGIAVLCAFASRCAAQRSSVGADLVRRGDRSALVAVEVTAVQKLPDGGHRATLKMVHVYSGPKHLKGLAVFTATANQGNAAGGTAIPLLNEGEAAVWVLHASDLDGTWQPRMGIRKSLVSDYDQVIKWAETVGELTGRDGPKRLELARELCGHQLPRIAKLGIEVLLQAAPADSERAGVPDFIDGLAKNRSITPAALACADRLLFARDGKTWLESERRKALLGRLTETMAVDDAAEVIDHVRGGRNVARDDNWMTAGEAVTILTELATDPRQTRAVRELVVKDLSDRGIHRDLTFAVLADVVRSSDNALRLAAAKGLAGLATPGRPPDALPSFTAKQLKELQALLKDEKDEKVAAALARAVRESTKPDR